jgi:coenzyme F420-reducing hydrogenase beta subunit
MINIKYKSKCCGCSACVQVCPKQCISFNEDTKGFLYPVVNKDLCIDCGLCEKVCPFLNLSDPRKPVKVLAAINPNEEIRMKSSSGGIFTMLAEAVIDEGGVVFGARFDKNWEVMHDYTETKEGLDTFRGAKYTQSKIGITYKEAKDFLIQGRKVLFSGTGCQIAGLRLFLHKEYDNLLMVEIACHGVPSPAVWRAYLDDVTKGNKNKINSINFRDKRNGWNEYGLTIEKDDDIIYELSANNRYMQSFLKNLCLRPSCVNCPVKQGASGTDLIIGDFWGVESIHPEIYDNKGCSFVVVNSDKGKEQIVQINTKNLEITYEEGWRYNPCLVQSSAESRYAPIFWRQFHKKGVMAINSTLKIFCSNRIQRMAYLIWYKVISKIQK